MVITLVAVAAGVSLASTNVHADVATQTVPTTTLTSSPQDGQVNAGDNNSGNQVKDNSSKKTDQQINADYKTPVNAVYIDTVTADTDKANTIDVSGWHATNQYKTGMDHYLIALNGDNNQ